MYGIYRPLRRRSIAASLTIALEDQVARPIPAKRGALAGGPLGRNVALDERSIALYQDFRKFEKKSKAGAIQEIFFKMAGAAKKKSGFPRKNLGSNPGIGLEQPTNLTTKSQGIDCNHASLR